MSGTAPNLAPVQAAYGNTTFGRTVYYIVSYAAVEPGGDFVSPAIQDMFVTTPASGGNPADVAKFCQAGDTIEQHGFLQVPDCGVLTNANRCAPHLVINVQLSTPLFPEQPSKGSNQ